MSRGDERLRELERRWLETGHLDDEVVYLIARQRAGALDPGRLAAAAALGDPAALEVAGPGFEDDAPASPTLFWARFPLPARREGAAAAAAARMAGAATLLEHWEQLVSSCAFAERAVQRWEQRKPGEFLPRIAWRAVRGIASESRRGTARLPFRITERFDELGALCRDVRTEGRLAAAVAAVLKLNGVLLGSSLDLTSDPGSIERIGLAVVCVALFAQDAAIDSEAEGAWQRAELSRVLLHSAARELRYSHTDVYTQGERVVHPKFGPGEVTAATLSRIDVRFTDRQRRLLHNRGP